jgi:malonyl CoA-acyl carrier protein transacylase
MNAEALAWMVAVGTLQADGTCNAWMDSADRRCGKPATHPYLCDRHAKVALARAKKAAEKRLLEARRHAEWRAVNEPKWRAELTKITAEITRLDPPTGPLDHGILNTPLRTRVPSDAKISRLADLWARRKRLENLLGVSAR